MDFIRLKRLRRNKELRALFSQTQILARNLVMPYFVIEGKDKKEPIKTMPGVYRLSLDNLLEDIEEIKSLGIKAVLLFGVSQRKDEKGSEAYNKNGLVQKAIKAIKREIKDMAVISDVCLCGYTSHGHCGIIRKGISIDNDATLRLLAKTALAQAEAGADLVAPSAMMDGQVKTIRASLDKNGFEEIGILAYSAKYASNFYGPFREALDSSPQFGDRKSYQMDYANSDEALREIRQDIDEGADIVMVKPALAYLDIIYRARQNFNIPVAAYNVSGEYSLVKLGSGRGLFNEREAILEILTAIKRAGADLIISYHAREAARWLRNAI